MTHLLKKRDLFIVVLNDSEQSVDGEFRAEWNPLVYLFIYPSEMPLMTGVCFLSTVFCLCLLWHKELSHQRDVRIELWDPETTEVSCCCLHKYLCVVQLRSDWMLLCTECQVTGVAACQRIVVVTVMQPCLEIKMQQCWKLMLWIHKVHLLSVTWPNS